MGYSTTVYIGTYNKQAKRKTIRAKTKEELQQKVKEAKDIIEQEKILAELEEKEKTKKQERQNLQNTGYVYLMECDGKYKVGYSRNIKERLKTLNCGLYKVSLIAKSSYLQNARYYELILHELYKTQNIRNEWFNLTARQVSEVKQLLNDFENQVMIFNIENRTVTYLNLNAKRRRDYETIQKLG